MQASKNFRLDIKIPENWEFLTDTVPRTRKKKNILHEFLNCSFCQNFTT